MSAGFERLHYLLESAFDADGDLNPAFLRARATISPAGRTPLAYPCMAYELPLSQLLTGAQALVLLCSGAPLLILHTHMLWEASAPPLKLCVEVFHSGLVASAAPRARLMSCS